MNDVLNEVIDDILKRQTDNIAAQQFSQQPFQLFYQLWEHLWEHLTPTEHQILQRQQSDVEFKNIVIRMIMQQILSMYPDDSDVWFAFGKVTAIIAWMTSLG